MAKQKEETIASEYADIIFAPNSGGLFVVSDVASMKAKSIIDKNQPTGITTQDVPAQSSGDIAKWGDNNLKPQDIKALIHSSFVLKSGFSKRFRQAFSNGIITKEWQNIDGKDILVRKRFPEFEEFQRRNNYGQNYTMQAIRDLLRFEIAFPELILSVDKTKILGLHAKKATHSRFSLQNTDGIIEKCYINADWAKNRDLEDKTKVKILDVAQQDYWSMERIKSGKATNYIYTVKTASDESYYPDQDWLSEDVYDLVDISKSWAKFVKHLMNNAAIINYVVFIKDWYWEARFGADAWSRFSSIDKAAKRKLEIDSINKNITGIDKAGKMLLVDVKTKVTSAMKNMGGGDLKDTSNAWEIKVLDQPKIDQTFLEAFNSANRSLQHTIQLDSSSYGSLSGEGDKGGSDKQQGYNISLIADQYLRQLVLQPYNFIKDFNGWSENMVIDFELPVMQTMANVPPDKRNIQPQK